MVPTALAAPADETATPLGGSGIALPPDSEGTFLAFAANTSAEDTPLASWTLEERGRYALTVFRAGDLSGETTVELRTIDDALADLNNDGVVNGKDVTLLRRYVAGGYGVIL